MHLCSILGCSYSRKRSQVVPVVDLNVIMNNISWEIPDSLMTLLNRDCHKFCADCGVEDTEWASLGFGILICLKCSGFHRSLGTHITSVRAVKLDTWSDQRVMYLEQGGNEEFTTYCESLELPAESLNGAMKYSHPQILFYSKLLKSKVDWAVSTKMATVASSGQTTAVEEAEPAVTRGEEGGGVPVVDATAAAAVSAAMQTPNNDTTLGPLSTVLDSEQPQKQELLEPESELEQREVVPPVVETSGGTTSTNASKEVRHGNEEDRRVPEYVEEEWIDSAEYAHNLALNFMSATLAGTTNSTFDSSSAAIATGAANLEAASHINTAAGSPKSPKSPTRETNSGNSPTAAGSGKGVPAEWANDRTIKACMICGLEFTTFFRRHHCRRCGRMVCNKCAPRNNSRPIPEWGLKQPERHCKLCYKSPIVKWADSE